MSELKAIVNAARNAQQAGQLAVLATVVDTAGSSYRLPGARMLVTGDGWQAGSISGGCLEGDIVKRGAWLARNGPVVVAYDTTDDDDIVHGLGLGCRGVIQVLIERLDNPHGLMLIDFLERCLHDRAPAAIATVIDAESGAGRRLLLDAGGTIVHDSSDNDARAALERAAHQALLHKKSATKIVETANGSIRAFIEFIAPATSLVIFGAGHDAMPLARLAKAMAFHVTVVDGRPSYAKAARFPEADQVLLCMPGTVPDNALLGPDAIALVMTHHYLSDQKILQTLLASPVRYIGVLGPKTRAQEMLSGIAETGCAIGDAQMNRIFAPVGLDIGAGNAEQVALSIIAEIQAFLSGRHGGHLRDRAAPIHADAGQIPAAPARINDAAESSHISSEKCLSPL
jgi:xanthine/CO dehydrogenase XdhC/CoxF family maturation factor